jgi:hypothetical protein
MVLLKVSENNRVAGRRKVETVSSVLVTTKTSKFAEDVGVQRFSTL